MSQSSVTLSPQALKAALLASPNAKLARADEHLDALYSETDRWGDDDPLTLLHESNADGSEHIVSLRYKVRPDLWRWATLFGDALYNLRGALDHMVYALAIAQTRIDPPDDDAKLAFPICSESGFFDGQRYRIASLSVPTRAAIEKAQPYNRLKAGKWFAPLWWLDQFHNIDKHRLAHLAATAAHPDEIVIDAEPGTYKALWNTSALVDGAPLLRLLMDPPNPDVYVDLKATGSVVLNVPEYQPMSLYWTTRHIRREVHIVCRYLTSFFPV